jgi:hypothetical protein
MSVRVNAADHDCTLGLNRGRPERLALALGERCAVVELRIASNSYSLSAVAAKAAVISDVVSSF